MNLCKSDDVYRLYHSNKLSNLKKLSLLNESESRETSKSKGNIIVLSSSNIISEPHKHYSVSKPNSNFFYSFKKRNRLKDFKLIQDSLKHIGINKRIDLNNKLSFVNKYQLYIENLKKTSQKNEQNPYCHTQNTSKIFDEDNKKSDNRQNIIIKNQIINKYDNKIDLKEKEREQIKSHHKSFSDWLFMKQIEVFNHKNKFIYEDSFVNLLLKEYDTYYSSDIIEFNKKQNIKRQIEKENNKKETKKENEIDYNSFLFSLVEYYKKINVIEDDADFNWHNQNNFYIRSYSMDLIDNEENIITDQEIKDQEIKKLIPKKEKSAIQLNHKMKLDSYSVSLKEKDEIKSLLLKAMSDQNVPIVITNYIKNTLEQKSQRNSKDLLNYLNYNRKNKHISFPIENPIDYRKKLFEELFKIEKQNLNYNKSNNESKEDIKQEDSLLFKNKNMIKRINEYIDNNIYRKTQLSNENYYSPTNEFNSRNHFSNEMTIKDPSNILNQSKNNCALAKHIETNYQSRYNIITTKLVNTSNQVSREEIPNIVIKNKNRGSNEYANRKNEIRDKSIFLNTYNNIHYKKDKKNNKYSTTNTSIKEIKVHSKVLSQSNLNKVSRNTHRGIMSKQYITPKLNEKRTDNKKKKKIKNNSNKKKEHSTTENKEQQKIETSNTDLPLINKTANISSSYLLRNKSSHPSTEIHSSQLISSTPMQSSQLISSTPMESSQLISSSKEQVLNELNPNKTSGSIHQMTKVLPLSLAYLHKEEIMKDINNITFRASCSNNDSNRSRQLNFSNQRKETEKIINVLCQNNPHSVFNYHKFRSIKSKFNRKFNSNGLQTKPQMILNAITFKDKEECLLPDDITKKNIISIKDNNESKRIIRLQKKLDTLKEQEKQNAQNAREINIEEINTNVKQEKRLNNFILSLNKYRTRQKALHQLLERQNKAVSPSF